MKNNYRIPLLLLIFAFFSSNMQGQLAEGFQMETQNLLSTNRTGMYVLGGWAAANLIGGTVLGLKSTGSNKYFHLMNAGWNVINISLAGAALLTADPVFSGQMDLINHQHKLEKTYLFNAGLDVGYMMAGVWLMERSKNVTKNREMLRGFGQSVLIQGAFLFVFDLVMYFVINH